MIIQETDNFSFLRLRQDRLVIWNLLLYEAKVFVVWLKEEFVVLLVDAFFKIREADRFFRNWNLKQKGLKIDTKG